MSLSPLLPANGTWAAIFDWDGVIINSADHHKASWELMAKEEGQTLAPDHFTRSFGMKNERVIREVFGWKCSAAEIERLSDRKEVLYRQFIRKQGLTPLPGVREWLSQLKAAGIPCAVGSSTPRANLEAAFELMDLRPFFSSLVTSEDVAKGKPDPEVFLRAAERLRVPPERCVVFEDAHVGIAAARAAGMKVVAVTTTYPAAQLSAADRIVTRLDELTVEQVAGVHGS
jgi:beta-phosphoglucomutase family hydrolase